MADDGEVLRLLGGGAWAYKLNWPPRGPPTTAWDGLLEVEDGRVTKLALLERRLTGSIPSQLGQLQSLEVLSLTYMQHTGSVPSELGQLKKLQGLLFYGNQLTGSIPSELGQLQSLQLLNLSDNQLTGSIPSELGQLQSLQFLNLSENQLTGSIPPELGRLQDLEGLDLSGNMLTGQIPKELGNLRHLNSLQLNSNYLEGVISESLWGLPALESLDLSSNGLEGSISPAIGNATSIAYLYITDNALTGEIPSSIGKLEKLVHFQMQGNVLSGSIPAAMGKLSALEILLLYNNKLTGEIPSELGQCKQLVYLDISNNELFGAFPAPLCGCAALKGLWLENNGLGGQLPGELRRLKQLELLSLSSNKFEGRIPASDMSELPNLQELYVDDNNLTVFDAATEKLLLDEKSELSEVRIAKNKFSIVKYEEFAKKMLDAREKVRKRQNDGEVSFFALEAAKQQRYSAAVQILELKPSSAPISAIRMLNTEFLKIKYFDTETRGQGKKSESGNKDEEEFKTKTGEIKRAASFMVWHAPSGEFMSEALQQDNQESAGITDSHEVLIEWIQSLESGAHAEKEKINYKKKFDDVTKKKGDRDQMQRNFTDHVMEQMGDSDAMLALIEEDTSFGIWSIFVLQCIFLKRHFENGGIEMTRAYMRRTLELILLVFTPLAILCIQLAFPVLIMYDEIDYLMLSGLDSSGYTNMGNQNVYFCPNANVNAASSDFAYTSSEGFHGSVALQRAAATFIAILYFSRYFMVARAKLSPPRARTEPEMRMGRKMELSYAGSWRMGLIDDLLDVVYEGTVYAINLRVALTGTTLINIILNSLALEFVMTLDNDWKDSYGKVYGNEVKAFLKRECYIDRDGFQDDPIIEEDAADGPGTEKAPKGAIFNGSYRAAADGAYMALEGEGQGNDAKDAAELESGPEALATAAGDNATANPEAEGTAEAEEDAEGEAEAQAETEESPTLTPEQAEDAARDRAQKYVRYFNSGYVVLLELYFLLAACWVPFCDVTTV